VRGVEGVSEATMAERRVGLVCSWSGRAGGVVLSGARVVGWAGLRSGGGGGGAAAYIHRGMQQLGIKVLRDCCLVILVTSSAGGLLLESAVIKDLHHHRRHLSILVFISLATYTTASGFEKERRNREVCCREIEERGEERNMASISTTRNSSPSRKPPTRRPKLMRASATAPSLAISNASRKDLALAGLQNSRAATLLTRVASYSSAQMGYGGGNGSGKRQSVGSVGSFCESPVDSRSPESGSMERKEPFEIVISQCELPSVLVLVDEELDAGDEGEGMSADVNRRELLQLPQL